MRNDDVDAAEKVAQTRRVLPPISPADSRFRLAWEAVDKADEVSLSAFGAASGRVRIKPDGSPVTQVDMDIERMFAETIARNFPQDAILSEESHRTGENTRWIIDPLDGTANFVEGLPIYAHLVCYQHSDSTVFSIVSAPALGARWWAYRGTGAFRAETRLRVSAVDRLSRARIGYGGLRDYQELLAPFVDLAAACLRARGLGNFLPHMLVAEGTYDLASAAPGCSEWDVAPLALVLEEAGGTLSDFEGKPWAASRELLTSNGVLHDEAVGRLIGRSQGGPWDTTSSPERAPESAPPRRSN